MCLKVNYVSMFVAFVAFKWVDYFTILIISIVSYSQTLFLSSMWVFTIMGTRVIWVLPFFFSFSEIQPKERKKESKSWGASSSFGLRVIVQDVYVNTKQRKIIYLYVKWAESKLYSFFFHYFTNLIYFPSWSISCLLYDVVF